MSEASQRSTIDKEFWFKPSRRENLVMTSKYERTSVRTDCLGEGEGRLKVTRTGKLKSAIFSWLEIARMSLLNSPRFSARK